MVSGMSGRYGSVSKSKHTEGIHTEHSTPFEKPAIDACRIGSERQSIVAIPFDGWRFHNTLFAFIQFVVCHPCLEAGYPHPPDGLPCRRRRPGEALFFPK